MQVVACPFLREKRKNNVTTVLQPCQVFFRSSQSPTSPQAMEISINSLTLKATLFLLYLILYQDIRVKVIYICLFFKLKSLHISSCLGVSNHHQHSNYHSVGADTHSGDPRGAGESCSCGLVGKTELEGVQILVPRRSWGRGHSITGPPDTTRRVATGA